MFDPEYTRSWNLERYGRHDGSKWICQESRDFALSLLITPTLQLTILSDGKVEEYLNLWGAYDRAKGVYLKDCLLFTYKSATGEFKIRVKFLPHENRSAMSMCEDCIAHLRVYFDIKLQDSDLNKIMTVDHVPKKIKMTEKPRSLLESPALTTKDRLKAILSRKASDDVTCEESLRGRSDESDIQPEYLNAVLSNPNFLSIVKRVEDVIARIL